MKEDILKIFITLFIVLQIISCTHFEETRRREVKRNYVFNIDKLGRNWPQGFQVEGKFSGTGPEIEHIKKPYYIDGNRLIEGHDIWLLKSGGRWTKSRGAHK